MKTGLFRPYFLFLLFPLGVSASFYEAPITESKWAVSVTRAECSLSHMIPDYGVAVFSQPAGRSLSFQLRAKRNLSPITQASLTVSAPAWMHEVGAGEHFAVYQEKSGRSGRVRQLSVQDQVAEVMLNELNEGWFPTFIYTTPVGSRMLVENQISVSAVNFRAAFEAFDDCRGRLLPRSFDEIRNSHLFFPSSGSKLGIREKKEVEMIAEYLALLPESAVLMNPFNRWGGKAAKKKFGQRVEAIKSVLVKKGVKSEQINSQFKRSSASADSYAVNLKLIDPASLTLLHYRPKSTLITRREKQQLRLLAEYFKKKRKNSRIIVNGHTDSRGSRQSNKKISAKRAGVVKQYLISQGVPKDRVQIKAWGERKPVSSNRSSRGQANNRRVQISFTG